MGKNSVLIVDGLRTPIGHPYGSLRGFTAAQLAALAIKEMIRRQKIKKNLISEVVLGNVVSAGTGQNLSRQASILAGLPEEIPCYTVNNVCGAGLQAIILAAQAVLADNADLVIAGGTESATHSPYFVKRQEAEDYTEEEKELNPVDTLIHDGLFCQMTQQRMGELVEALAHKYDISRDEQDVYSFESHRKACAAQAQKRFSKEIVPLTNSKKKRIFKDEHPRRHVDVQYLERLPPMFWTAGTVTAGNSSLACDGAAVTLLASPKAVKSYRLKPHARILGYVSVAVKPELTFESSVKAIEMCLKKCRLSVEDIELFEISEAFAAQVVLARKKLNIPLDKLNVFGGDLAFGHPLGAAGTRIIVTLMNALHRKRAKKGMACVSYGGGGAIAMILEAVF